MHGDRVADEGVDGEHVELLGFLGFHREARVAERYGGSRRAIGEIGELVARDLRDDRVDLVEAVGVARAAIGRDRARAETDHADLERALLGELIERDAHAGDARIIGERLAALFGRGELLAVIDAAVEKLAPRQFGRGERHVGDAERAVEIAREQHAALQVAIGVDRHVGRRARQQGHRHREHHVAQVRPLGGAITPPGGRDHDRARQGHDDLKLEIGDEHERRDGRDEQSAERAACRNDQVVRRQITRLRPHRSELAVADEAAHEQAEREQRQEAIIVEAGRPRSSR